MTVVYGILGLGFLVFFHELGHFVAARICGVKVESFSIGMGPVLLHHQWGQTDYRLSLIPLGGYCGMKGQKDFQTALDENDTEIRGDKDSYYGVHPVKRMLIAFAGPFFNLFFTFIAFFVIALIGYNYYSAGCQVNMTRDIEGYTELPSPAYDAGLRSGDTILTINNKEMTDFTDIAEYISLHGNEDLAITVDREGEQLSFNVHSLLDKDTGSGKIGIVSMPESVVVKEYPKHSFFGAIKEGVLQTGKLISTTIKSLGILFKGINLTKAVSGPARITTMLGDTVKESFTVSAKVGVISTLEFLALLSISLFIMNLLPLPILDGGLILFSIIEWIRGKKLSPKFLYYIQFVGLAFIGFLLVLALTGDIQYFILKFKR